VGLHARLPLTHPCVFCLFSRHEQAFHFQGATTSSLQACFVVQWECATGRFLASAVVAVSPHATTLVVSDVEEATGVGARANPRATYPLRHAQASTEAGGDTTLTYGNMTASAGSTNNSDGSNTTSLNDDGESTLLRVLLGMDCSDEVGQCVVGVASLGGCVVSQPSSSAVLAFPMHLAVRHTPLAPASTSTAATITVPWLHMFVSPAPLTALGVHPGSLVEAASGVGGIGGIGGVGGGSSGVGWANRTSAVSPDAAMFVVLQSSVKRGSANVRVATVTPGLFVAANASRATNGTSPMNIDVARSAAAVSWVDAGVWAHVIAVAALTQHGIMTHVSLALSPPALANGLGPNGGVLRLRQPSMRAASVEALSVQDVATPRVSVGTATCLPPQLDSASLVHRFCFTCDVMHAPCTARLWLVSQQSQTDGVGWLPVHGDVTDSLGSHPNATDVVLATAAQVGELVVDFGQFSAFANQIHAVERQLMLVSADAYGRMSTIDMTMRCVCVVCMRMCLSDGWRCSWRLVLEMLCYV